MAKFRRNDEVAENNTVDFMLGRIGDEFETEHDLSDYIWQEIDNGMIYTSDQWQMLQDYIGIDDLNENSLGEAFEYLLNDLCRCYDEVEEVEGMTEDEIRDDFETALRKVEDGTDLSGVLDYFLDNEDKVKLANLHKEYPELREKIENLLNDCNYSIACDYLCDGEYDEYIKQVENNEL